MGENMDKFPLLYNGEIRGELTREQEKLYIWLEAHCPLPREEGLWCVWVIGETGELRLGILEPQGEFGRIRRRFSRQSIKPLGILLRGEIRPNTPPEAEVQEVQTKIETETEAEQDWSNQDFPAELVSWIADRKSISGAVWRRTKECFFLAIPYESNRPFPLSKLFCFAQVQQFRGKRHAIFTFDLKGRPVF